MLDLAPEPSAAHHTFTTTNADEAHDHVTQTFAAHRLRLIGHDQVKFRLDSASTAAVTVGRMSYGTRSIIEGPPMRDCYHVNVLISGHCEVAQGMQRKRFSAENSSGVVFGPAEPVFIDWSADSAQYHLKLSRTVLEEHAAKLVGTRSAAVDFDLAFTLGTPAGRALQASIAFYHSQLRPQGGLAAMPTVQREMESALMTQVLIVARNNLTPLLMREAPPDVDSTIRDLMEYIKLHAEEDLSVASLVGLAGVSLRTLQAGFRRVAGVPPTEFIRNVRLDCVRSDLVGGKGDSIAEVALRWHFAHLGRFAAHYRSRFGESPSQTLRR